MQIAQSKTREQFPLSYKKIIKKTLSSAIVYSIVLIVLWVIIVSILGSIGLDVINVIGITTLVILGLLFVLVLLNYYYQRWYFAVYFYDLTSDYIQIKKGPITPREITIPYERIQDVYVDQDLLDRIFGLYDVHLSSATISSGIEAHIDGVEKAATDGLRNMLLKTVHERISKNRQTSNSPTNNPVNKTL